MIASCERVGVCPRLLVEPWTGGVMAAMSWWENGALGIAYLDAPAWLHAAFSIIGRERMSAHRYRHELERQK